jgi:uncharacterized Zn-binding protein involved in type VI secretion
MKPIARLRDLHSCPKKGCGTTPIVTVASISDYGGTSIAIVLHAVQSLFKVH